MIRKAFRMRLYPDQVEEYTKRHNPIWPELAETLREHGVTNYSIFLDQDSRTLFGYAEIRSEAEWDAIADTEVCRRWWQHMEPLMETNEDSSPVSQELREVFYLS